ncbi:hypothetical protein HWV62_30509 [Athelia sp. TMB]|nr:hypothetical protein HWV62_30509 [Athelia sp. TMB]
MRAAETTLLPGARPAAIPERSQTPSQSSRAPSLLPSSAPMIGDRVLTQQMHHEHSAGAQPVPQEDHQLPVAQPPGQSLCARPVAHPLPLARQPYREPAVRHQLEQMDISCSHCGALHWIDERTSSSSRRSPEFGACCDHGQVQLGALERPPHALRQLYLGTSQQGREFLENIRQYNAALAFTSLGVEQDNGVNIGPGPYVFRIHGVLCHRAGSLLPPQGRSPTYAQLYIHDPRAALQYRISRNGNLRADTLELLQDVISTSHYYAGYYQHAYDILRNERVAPDSTIRLQCHPNQDRRRYNLPTVDEVAAIVPGDGTQRMDSRDIILRLRGEDAAIEEYSGTHPGRCK